MSIAAKRLHGSLGTEVGLGPDDIALDGDPAPPSPKRGQSPLPNFRPMSIVAKRSDGRRLWPLGTEVDFGPGHFVLDGFPAIGEKGTAAPLFGPYLL